MDSNENEGKKPLRSLNVVSSKEHKGFGAGSIDLSNLSSVIIDGEEAYIDIGALHAKSKVERGIKFTVNQEEVPNGRKCWIVWVAVDRRPEGGSYYAGVTACEMSVDPEAKKGWKILADHVNKMDYALKRRIILDGLNETEKAALKRCLQENNAEWWDNSLEQLKQGLA
ncbi:YwhD family protein [Paenibacillus turpanensis]|uniref:YwhD family protein n=1 Tax=Paenibacillus turpanensis TaxID=2689078 RepID=UPI00140B8E37|nr:YwhD family protein [Paenibacillus turpanensis]